MSPAGSHYIYQFDICIFSVSYTNLWEALLDTYDIPYISSALQQRVLGQVFAK